MSKTFKDRLLRLKDIEEVLKEERRFYMSRKDWPNVQVRTDALKRHKEQVARVMHLSAREMKDTYKSA